MLVGDLMGGMTTEQRSRAIALSAVLHHALYCEMSGCEIGKVTMVAVMCDMATVAGRPLSTAAATCCAPNAAVPLNTYGAALRMHNIKVGTLRCALWRSSEHFADHFVSPPTCRPYASV